MKFSDLQTQKLTGMTVGAVPSTTPAVVLLDLPTCFLAFLIADVLGGYNGTVFAYGQTSSGKTYTMEVQYG